MIGLKDCKVVFKRLHSEELPNRFPDLCCHAGCLLRSRCILLRVNADNVLLSLLEALGHHSDVLLLPCGIIQIGWIRLNWRRQLEASLHSIHPATYHSCHGKEEVRSVIEGLELNVCYTTDCLLSCGSTSILSGLFFMLSDWSYSPDRCLFVVDAPTDKVSDEGAALDATETVMLRGHELRESWIMKEHPSGEVVESL